jgi:hypothetical protein
MQLPINFDLAFVYHNLGHIETKALYNESDARIYKKKLLWGI